VAVATEPTDDALWRRWAVHAACRAEAASHGIDLKDFGTSVTVADFEWVRRALGVEHWNVYGEFYGTTAAMTLLASHSDMVRSAVLDSVYPPDPGPLRSVNVADALDALFRYCTDDQACAAAYPDLAATWRETLAGLARAPLIVSVPSDVRMLDNRVRLTSSLFELLVNRLITYPTS
jgi:pimeloyl-ACP methyl ester carboxylesterase